MGHAQLAIASFPEYKSLRVAAAESLVYLESLIYLVYKRTETYV